MKTVLIPDDLYESASVLAEADQVSVDRLIAAIVGERGSEWNKLKARASRGSLESFRNVLAKVGDATPEPMDRL